jgi:alpha-tubulin suppressor-like RCC1 family protein
VTDLVGATQIATGNAHTCALAGTSVYCWGDNSVGQLGLGSPSRALTPAVVTLP